MTMPPPTGIPSAVQDLNGRDATILRFLTLIEDMRTEDWLSAVMLVNRLGGLSDAETLSIVGVWADD